MRARKRREARQVRVELTPAETDDPVAVEKLIRILARLLDSPEPKQT